MRRRALIACMPLGLSAPLAGCMGGGDPPDDTNETDSESHFPSEEGDQEPPSPDVPQKKEEAVSEDDSPEFAGFEGSVQPDGDPPAIPGDLTCDLAGFERFGQYSDEQDIIVGTTTDGEDPGFALRANRDSYRYGDTVHIELRNLSDGLQVTGSANTFNFQLLTEAGWEEVRGDDLEEDWFVQSLVGYIIHPGEGYTWAFEFTEEGIEGISQEPLQVCPELQPGRYRFLYHSADLAVEFDLYRD